MRLPDDVLALVCSHFWKKPRFVFLVMMACKGLRRHLTDRWWRQFWRANQTYNVSLLHPRHWLLQSNQWTVRQYPALLRLAYGLRCECCGGRWHHKVQFAMKKRVCRLCMQEKHISSRVLMAKYGLHAGALLVRWHRFVRYVPLQSYRSASALLQFTRDPTDLEVLGLAEKQLLFIWRSDLEAVVDLPAAKVEHEARVGACRLLQSTVRRLWISLRRRRYFLEEVYVNEARRPSSRVPLVLPRSRVETILMHRLASVPVLSYCEFTLKTAVEFLGRLPPALMAHNDLTRVFRPEADPGDLALCE